MKGFIIDDEAKSRRILKALCEEYNPDLEIVGVAASVKEAKRLLQELRPDLVFLDIEMPQENGFALLDYFENSPPFEVVFTTAYDQYALQAFQSSAIEYLLKPIEIEELIKAVDKVRKLLPLAPSPRKIETLKKLLTDDTFDKIGLVTSDGFTFVKYSEIVRCEGDGNYTTIYFSDDSFLLLAKTLKYYDAILSEHNFFRTHRSHLVNLNYVRRFIKGRQSFIEMTNGQKVEVSSAKREALLKSLNP